MILEGDSPGASERAGDQSPHWEEAELGNVPTASTAASTSASSLPLLDLKTTTTTTTITTTTTATTAAAALQVIPEDAPPARAIVLLLWGCLSVFRTVRQVGLPHLILEVGGLILGKGLRLEEGLTLGKCLMLD